MLRPDLNISYEIKQPTSVGCNLLSQGNVSSILNGKRYYITITAIKNNRTKELSVCHALVHLLFHQEIMNSRQTLRPIIILLELPFSSATENQSIRLKFGAISHVNAILTKNVRSVSLCEIKHLNSFAMGLCFDKDQLNVNAHCSVAIEMLAFVTHCRTP